MEIEYINETNRLIDFIAASPTAFHAVQNLKERLLKEGYKELQEGDAWTLSLGDKCFVTRNLSSIIAFKVPADGIKSLLICASHCDSPTFKLKPNPKMSVANAYTVLNTERYGGMALSSWLDRPLSLAGRLVVRTETGIKTVLADVKRPICVIPSLAPHMQTAADKNAELNPQRDLLPLIGADGTDVMALLAESADAAKADILGSDIFLYNSERGVIFGAENEYFSAPRIDDLQCVYASTEAFLSAENANALMINAVFDNEEVGSGTKQGAKSTFMSDVISRIAESLSLTPSELKRCINSGFMLSADNAHALHPNRADKCDPTSRPLPNRGVVIKYNANQRYTTDAVSAAVVSEIFERAGVPYQSFANRSDIPGGSTLGNLANEQVSLNTVDIGLAQLAMHSCYETGGVKDTLILERAVKAFFGAGLKCECDGVYSLG